LRRQSLEKICPKILCEICNERNKAVLHRHHIVEQTELNCTNSPYNLAVICSNCHNKHHAGVIKILGILPSTKLPLRRTLVYINESGICNVVGINESDFKRPEPQTMKLLYAVGESNEEESCK
jgi:hypothetical protein